MSPILLYIKKTIYIRYITTQLQAVNIANLDIISFFFIKAAVFELKRLHSSSYSFKHNLLFSNLFDIPTQRKTDL